MAFPGMERCRLFGSGLGRFALVRLARLAGDSGRSLAVVSLFIRSLSTRLMSPVVRRSGVLGIAPDGRSRRSAELAEMRS